MIVCTSVMLGYAVVALSILHVSMALTTFLTFEQNVVSFDLSIAGRYLGTAKPIKIPKMSRTMSSSTRVKPLIFLSFLTVKHLLLFYAMGCFPRHKYIVSPTCYFVNSFE